VVNVTRKSSITGQVNTMTLNCSVDEYAEGEQSYTDGALLQHAFPFLDADEREFIKTGVTPTEWNLFYGMCK
jgi:hypothetical protein